MPFVKSALTLACLLAAAPLFAAESEAKTAAWTGSIKILKSGSCSLPKKTIPASYQIEFTSPSEFVATPILPITKLLSPTGIIHGVVAPDGSVTTSINVIVTCSGKEQLNTYPGTGKLNGNFLEFTTTENVCPQLGCTFVRKYTLSKGGI